MQLKHSTTKTAISQSILFRSSQPLMTSATPFVDFCIVRSLQTTERKELKIVVRNRRPSKFWFSFIKRGSATKQWRIQGGPERPCPPPPLAAWKKFFASILILLLSRLHTMDRGNTKVAVCRRFLFSNRLVFAAFCCFCAVHCMQAAAASFFKPKCSVSYL